MKRVAIEREGGNDTAAAELTALRRAAQTLGTSVELDTVAAHSLDEVMTLLGAHCGSLHVAAPDGKSLLRRAAVNMPDEVLQEEVPATDVAQWIGDAELGVYDVEGNEPGRRVRAAWEHGLRRVFFVPLGDVKQPMGLMSLGLTTQGTVSASLLETLLAVTRLQVAAIANASAHEQQRLASLRLEEQNQRFVATLEDLPVAMHVLNRKGEVVMLNRAARDFHRTFLGAPLEATWTEGTMQLAYFTLEGKPIAMSELPIARAFAGQHAPPVEMRIVSPDSKQEMFSITSAVPIRFAPDGTVLEVVGVVLDVTQQRSLADAKDRFLRIASHELRSPITSLRATTGLLELDPTLVDDSARRQSLLARINRQVDRLTQLIDQLLDSARLHSKELPLHPETSQLDALCEEALEYLVPDAQSRQIVVERTGDLRGEWDRLRIEQLVTNLVNNALRHSPPDRPVRLALFGDATTCRIEVIDSGVGVPADQIDRLFTPFFRATNAPPRGGIGLGLYISSEIVRRHGGKISAAPRPEGGMVFSVTLPKLFNPDSQQT